MEDVPSSEEKGRGGREGRKIGEKDWGRGNCYLARKKLLIKEEWTLIK